MKKILLILALGLLPVGVVAQTITGSISAAGSTCNTNNVCVILTFPSSTGAVGVNISGTLTATLQFEATADGTNWSAINATPPNSTTAVTSATAVGTWQINAAGMQAVRVRASALSAGPAVVTIQASTASARSGGGSGSGVSGSGTTGTIAKFTASTAVGNAAAADIVSLFSTCAGTQYLGADAACHNAGGGNTYFGPGWKLGVAQGTITTGGTAGVSYVGSNLQATRPVEYAYAGDATHPTVGKPSFTVGTSYEDYEDTLSSSYSTNGVLTFIVSWSNPTDTNVGHVMQWGVQMVCISQSGGAVLTTYSAVQNFTATAISGTTALSTVSLALTPNAGGISACGAGDNLRYRISTVSGGTTITDTPVAWFIGGHS